MVTVNTEKFNVQTWMFFSVQFLVSVFFQTTQLTLWCTNDTMWFVLHKHRSLRVDDESSCTLLKTWTTGTYDEDVVNLWDKAELLAIPLDTDWHSSAQSQYVAVYNLNYFWWLATKSQKCCFFNVWLPKIRLTGLEWQLHGLTVLCLSGAAWGWTGWMLCLLGDLMIPQSKCYF